MDEGTYTGSAQSTIIQNTAALQQTLIENSSHMTEEQLKQNQLLLDANKILQDRHLAAAQNLEDIEKENDELSAQTRRKTMREQGKDFDSEIYMSSESNLARQMESYSKIKAQKEAELAKTTDASLTRQLKLDLTRQLKLELIDLDDQYNHAVDTFVNTSGTSLEAADKLAQSYVKAADAQREMAKTGEELSNNQTNLQQRMQQVITKVDDYADNIVKGARAVSQITTSVAIFSKT